MKVTITMNKYLMVLEKGQKTTNDLMLHFMVSMDSAGRIVKRLRDANLIESTKKRHRLIKPYKELVADGLIVSNNHKGKPVEEEELLYVASLRKEGLTGQRLSTQYRKRYPDRKEGAVKNIVLKARKQGLCR